MESPELPASKTSVDSKPSASANLSGDALTGEGDTVEGKPIDSVRLDVEDLKSLYKKF